MDSDSSSDETTELFYTLGLGFTNPPSPVVIEGPPRSGRSSLLLAVARSSVRCARNLQQGPIRGAAWFICQRDKIEEILPIDFATSQNRSALGYASSELDAVSLKYLTRASELKWWALNVFQGLDKDELPLMVIVDDFDLLLDAESLASVELIQRAVIHLLALLRGVAVYISEARGFSCPLVLSISSTCAWLKEIRCILERESNGNYQRVVRFGQADYKIVDLNGILTTNFRWEGAFPGAPPCFQIQPN
mmetsp:Transcript_41925/g.94720  ORF Transcript_41925/g.94720 Transcript_41925/m.94720 type:complete len:249 (+) Transcript_41925:130-876(+)